VKLQESFDNVAVMDGEPTDDGSPRDTRVLVSDTEKLEAGEGGLLKALDDSKNSADVKPALRPDQVANAVAFLTNPKVVVCYRDVDLVPSLTIRLALEVGSQWALSALVCRAQTVEQRDPSCWARV
jgi:hypothetical protein